MKYQSFNRSKAYLEFSGRDLLFLGADSPDGFLISFDPPLMFFDDLVLQDGGHLRISTNFAFLPLPGTGYSTITVTSVGTVTVPAGIFHDCLLVNWELTWLPSMGGTEIILATDAMILAPDVGRIKIAVVGQNFEFLEWAVLESGIVAGKQVKKPQLQNPKLLSPVWTKTDGFAAILEGQPEVTYRVQWSTNLVNWSDFAAIVLTNTTVNFRHSRATIYPTHYYRAVTP